MYFSFCHAGMLEEKTAASKGKVDKARAAPIMP
jgi:hypothetical protein